MGNSCRCKRNTFPSIVSCKQFHYTKDRQFSKSSLTKGKWVADSSDTTQDKKLLYEKPIRSLIRKLWNTRKNSPSKNGTLPQDILVSINSQQSTPSTNTSRNSTCSWEATSNILKDVKPLYVSNSQSQEVNNCCLETARSTKQVIVNEQKNCLHAFGNKSCNEVYFKESEEECTVSPKNTFEFHRQALLESPDSKMSHETKVSTTASTHSADSILNPCQDELKFDNETSCFLNPHICLTTSEVTLTESETDTSGYSPCKVNSSPYRIVNPVPFLYFQDVATTQLTCTRLACNKNINQNLRSKNSICKRISRRRYDKLKGSKRLVYPNTLRHLQPKKKSRNQRFLCTRLIYKKTPCREQQLSPLPSHQALQYTSVKHEKSHTVEEGSLKSTPVIIDINECETKPPGCNKIDHLAATTNEFQKFFCCSSSSSKNPCPSLFVESQETPLFSSPCYPENWNKESSSTPHPRIKMDLQFKKILQLKGLTTDSVTNERSHTDRPMLRGSMRYHHPLATSRLCY